MNIVDHSSPPWYFPTAVAPRIPLSTVAWGPLLVILISFAVSPGEASGQAPYPVAYEEIEGTLSDGTLFLLRRPENWNRIVVSDLDFRTRAEHEVYRRLLADGFGLSGTARRADRAWTVSQTGDISRTLEALSRFKEEFGIPDTVIAFGRSAGGGTVLGISELHPETAHGAVALCATIGFLVNNQIFDFLYVLKELLAPDDSRLLTHGLPRESAPIRALWRDAITSAAATSEGRARIAMAFTLAEFPAFGSTSVELGTPIPDFGDPIDVARAMRESALRIVEERISLLQVFELDEVPDDVPPHLVRALPNRSYVGNDGADYTEYWHLSDLVYRRVTEALYAEAGLEVTADLRRLEEAERVAMDRLAATARLGEASLTVRGLPRIPLFRVENTGDQTNHPSPTMASYSELVRRNGLDELYRTGMVAPGGHCYFTPEQELAAIHVMLDRLRTGEWPATDAAALNGRAGTDDPEGRAFQEVDMTPYNGMWRLRAYSDVFGIDPERTTR